MLSERGSKLSQYIAKSPTVVKRLKQLLKKDDQVNFQGTWKNLAARKEHQKKQEDHKKLVESFSPKIMAIAGILDGKTVSRIKRNISNKTRVKVSKRDERIVLPKIKEKMLEESLNSSEQWELRKQENFNSELDLHSTN